MDEEVKVDVPVDKIDIENTSEKRIEVVEMRVGDLKTGFGNPRKIKKPKRDELKKSMEMLGNFGIIVIDEDNNIIAGHQRVSVLMEEDPEQMVLCKKLIGYSDNEKKAINIKANTHAGEWDMDLLADWTADLNLGLDLEVGKKDPGEQKIKEMEPIQYEKYDYVMIVCRNEVDYNDLTRKLGIDGAKVRLSEKKKIKARAIWYDEIKTGFFDDNPNAEEEK